MNIKDVVHTLDNSITGTTTAGRILRKTETGSFEVLFTDGTTGFYDTEGRPVAAGASGRGIYVPTIEQAHQHAQRLQEATIKLLMTKLLNSDLTTVDYFYLETLENALTTTARKVAQ